jgi:T5orf172 domain
MDEFFNLRDIAKEIGVTYQTVKSRTEFLEIEVVQIQNDKNMYLSAIRAADLAKLKDSLTNKSHNENGFFYIIALVPEYNRGRLKVGFASNVEERLGQHRTAAPTAELVRSWPCKRAFEKTIIAALSSLGKQVRNEVYDFDSVELIVAKADMLFSLLNIAPPISFDN